MKKEISQNLKTNRILSCLSILIGTILLIYMITVEDEPGALPLFLIISGSAWFFITQYRIKKILH
jgi:hypothetical protein